MTAISDMTIHPLFNDQLALEKEMAGMGLATFQSQVQKAKKRETESETGYGKALLKNLLDPLIAGINEFVALANSGRAGPKHRAVEFIPLLEPEIVAFLSLKSLLDTVSKRSTLQKAALRIANSIQDEVMMRRYKGEDKGEHKATLRHIKNATSQRHKRTVARLMAGRSGVVMEWADDDKVLLGTKLIEIVRATTGMVDLVRTTNAHHDTPYLVIPTLTTMEWISKASGILSALSPAYLPTIIPPRPWVSPFEGGYWSAETKRLTVVKTRNRNYLEELAGASMEAVYASLNSMQNTPWKVNLPVLSVLKTAWTCSMKIKGLPPEDALELPFKPVDIDTNELARKDWKKRASKVYAAEHKRRSKRVQLDRLLELAERFSHADAIYFPHTLDFRGRAYSVPMFLNPQGHDTAKALLTFAEGKPIANGVAAGWLAVHGANTYGFDKASLEERVEWTEKHTPFIVSVAADPLGEHFDFWTKSDKPWQFLAFCFEWAGYQKQGFAFVSALPIGMDGSCNGLQHYSAALRDPVGGKAVNLTPSATPSDIYAQVGDVTLTYVTSYACPEQHGIVQLAPFKKAEALWKGMGINPVDMARRWQAFGINRKITKRAVMTLPYGSTQFSCREFIEESIRERLEEGAVNTFALSADDDGIFKASLWLQPMVWHAIGEVVQAARVGMGWLKECAKLAAGEGLPIYWRTADGFQVMQAYQETSSRRIKTHIDGQMIRLSIASDLETIDKRSQQQGIAPNWVHSMDATALRMFVNLAAENGINSFALVHDSYGTVAADVDLMGACLRRAFVNLYTDCDPLAEFRVDISMLISEEAQKHLPQVPPKGDLDISLVEESDFFFA